MESMARAIPARFVWNNYADTVAHGKFGAATQSRLEIADWECAYTARFRQDTVA